MKINDNLQTVIHNVTILNSFAGGNNAGEQNLKYHLMRCFHQSGIFKLTFLLDHFFVLFLAFYKIYVCLRNREIRLKDANLVYDKKYFLLI